MDRILRCAGLALVLAGCAGPLRPTVGPTVSSLPDQPETREELLASVAARPGPETGRSSANAEKVETVGATLAAFMGMLFSSPENTFIGLAIPFEENRLVAPEPRVVARPDAKDTQLPAQQGLPALVPSLEERAAPPRRPAP